MAGFESHRLYHPVIISLFSNRIIRNWSVSRVPTLSQRKITFHTKLVSNSKESFGMNAIMSLNFIGSYRFSSSISSNNERKKEKKVILEKFWKSFYQAFLIRISIFLFLLAVSFGVFQLIHLDFTFLLNKIKSMLLGRSLYFLFNRLGWAGGLFLATLYFLFDGETWSGGNKMAPSGADEGPSTSSTWRGSWIGRWVCPDQEGPSSAPNEGSAFTKVKTFFISCLGGHPPTKDILPEQAPRNWVEEADLPQAHPDDTVNDLREKIAIILESFFKNNPREHETFLDIAQRLALESKQSCGDGVSRQDFVRLLGALQDPSNPVYLKALECLEKHPR